MAGFEVAINGRFWVATEAYIAQRVSRGLPTFNSALPKAGNVTAWEIFVSL
jgi:hypothetical protein